MKYKALLLGANRSIIDDFFSSMYNTFDCVTTSTRFDDIINHIKFFKPDLIVYCLNNEQRENISQMVAVSQRFRGSIPLVIIGDSDECNEFTKIAINIVSLVITKPITAQGIQTLVVEYFNSKKQEEAMAEPSSDKFKKSFTNESAANSSYNNSSTINSTNSSSINVNSDSNSINDSTSISRRRNILVIDDDILMLRMIKEQLHELYDVATALNGKLALKYLQTKPVDLILLDYEMPDENGPAVLEKIREYPNLVDIPVLFLTGVTEREKIQNALSLKPQGYLLKPIDHKKLIDSIAQFIN